MEILREPNNIPEKYIAAMQPINNSDFPAILNFNDTNVFINPEPDIKKEVLKSNNPIERKISFNLITLNIYLYIWYYAPVCKYIRKLS